MTCGEHDERDDMWVQVGCDDNVYVKYQRIIHFSSEVYICVSMGEGEGKIK